MNKKFIKRSCEIIKQCNREIIMKIIILIIYKFIIYKSNILDVHIFFKLRRMLMMHLINIYKENEALEIVALTNPPS